MDQYLYQEVVEFVNENIGTFHERRKASLENITLAKLLTKNPYLLRSKNITTVSELIDGALDAFLSSSEEKLFGDFLEDLAIFVAEKTCHGLKSAAQGIDLEFSKNNKLYVISIKSGSNWGNSSQHRQLETDLQNAVKRIRMSKRGFDVEAVLGICYGKAKTSRLHGYLKVVGQNFWYLISDSKELYKDIIEPIGYNAKGFNDDYQLAKSQKINNLTQAFLAQFSTNGIIDWPKLVVFNSQNFDLDKFFL